MNTTFNVSEFLERSFKTFRIKIFIICGLIIAIEAYDQLVLGSILVPLSKAFGTTPAGMVPVMIAQGLGMATGAYTISVLADRIGRRWAIIICTLMFGLMTLLVNTSTTVMQFAVWRFLAFLFLGGVIPNLYAIVVEYYPKKLREQMIVYMNVIIGAMAGISMMVAPVLLQKFGWNMIFWIGGIVPLILLPFVYFFLPESIRFLILREGNNDKVAGILKSMDPKLDLTGVVDYTIEEQKSGKSPIIGLFRNKRYRSTILIWIAMALTTGLINPVYMQWMPTIFHQYGGIPVAEAGRMMIGHSVGSIAAPFLLVIISTYLMKTKYAVAMFSALAGILFLSLNFIDSYSNLGWLITLVAWGFCGSSMLCGINAIAAVAYPTEMRATGIGWAQGAARFTAIFAPFLGALIIGQRWSLMSISLTFMIPLLIAAIAIYFLPYNSDEHS